MSLASATHEFPIVNWHDFLAEVLKPENGDRELCAWLHGSWPYGSDEEWHVLRVKVTVYAVNPETPFDVT